MERPWREKEPPFGGCSYSLQTSLNLPELPPNPRRFRSEDLFRFLKTAGIWGKFLDWAGGADFLKGAERDTGLWQYRKKCL